MIEYQFHINSIVTNHLKVINSLLMKIITIKIYLNLVIKNIK